MSDLYSRDNLTTTEVTPGLLHEVAASLLRNTTKKARVPTTARVFNIDLENPTASIERPSDIMEDAEIHALQLYESALKSIKKRPL